MPLTTRIQVSTELSPEQRQTASDLGIRARLADGVAALSEQSLLSLAGGSSSVLHHLAYAGDSLVGYAQLAPDEGSAELVVDPSRRRQGVGTTLWESLVAARPEVRVWAHGNLPAAQGLASTLGLEAVRELHKMSRTLSADDAGPVALPHGFHARAFEPGQDERPWLDTNAAAFAHHAEQGRLTMADLQERMDQPWFDPDGFVIVEADDAPGRVAAFHWTKVDPEQRSSVDPARTAGEVYVVGVHPAYQGRGLGRPLTALGLAHLAELGLPEVVLYVDGDNTAALRTYRGMGFDSIMVDVMYARTAQPGLSG